MRLLSTIPFASAALALAVLAFAAPAPAADTVDPVKDAAAFRKFFTDKFPKVKLDDFVNGPYSMNEDLHRQWEEKEQFPPYEFSLEMGKEMFTKPFKNGKSYQDCFPNKGIAIRQNYPYFDPEPGRAHPRRSAGAGARHHECDADLSVGMERHGHHQPALHHLQQPDPRRAAQSAGR